MSDAEFEEWQERVKRELVPMIEESAASVSLLPEGEVDVKFAVELGLSIMLGKPIIVAVRPGVKVPLGLVKVADEIVEVDLQKNRQAGADAINAAVRRILREE